MFLMEQDLFKQAIEETCELVRRAGNRRGMLSVSPEVADLLQGLTQRPSPAAPAPRPEPLHSTANTASLEALREQVAACTKCPLHATRTQTVFGDGPHSADMVFVGEAPGQEEDRQGLPFVGPAGQLLTDIIVKGMHLERSQVYICNVLKCRPPNNRDPLPEEKEVCEPYLVKQLELLRPKVICALGGHAAQTLLKTEDSVGRLRGTWHFYHGIPLRVTYHPAYLLRNTKDKTKTWADIQEIMRVLSGEVHPQP